MSKIYISLTSMRSRLSTVHLTIKSILEQDYHDLKVCLYLSQEPYLLDEGISELSEELTELVNANRDRLEVHFTRNIGPYRKLLPFLWENWGQEKLVVTADDDTIYPPHWLSTLHNYYQKYRCSIAFRGHRIVVKNGQLNPYRSWMRDRVFENPSKLILPTGKDGILYNTSMFPESVLSLDTAMSLAPTADDMWFRWNLAMNGVPVFVVTTDYTDTFEESNYDTSLYLNFNKDGGNDRVVDALNEFFVKKKNFDLAKTSAL